MSHKATKLKTLKILPYDIINTNPAKAPEYYIIFIEIPCS